jgi:hypothetical protein
MTVSLPCLADDIKMGVLIEEHLALVWELGVRATFRPVLESIRNVVLPSKLALESVLELVKDASCTVRPGTYLSSAAGGR